MPNDNTAHQRATPRGAGIVFMSLWLLSVMVMNGLMPLPSQVFWVLLVPTFLVMLIGFWDDCHSLGIRIRVIVYLLSAVMAIYLLGGFTQIFLTHQLILPLSWLGSCIGVLAIMWSLNLFNFMDGIDAIAAVEAIFVLGIGAVLLFLSGAEQLSLLALMLVASVGGFLIWNKPPAKLFMGDAGSVSLGCAIILFAMIGERLYDLPFLLWMMLYILFLFDATVTLIRRMLAGEKWYLGHRLHAYQRLQQAGWSQKKILLGVILLNLIFSGFALLGFFYRDLILVLLLLSVVLLSIVYRKIESLSPMFSIGAQINEITRVD